MKHVSLLAPAVIAGGFHYPSEGVIQISDEETERLVAAGLAKDVSEEFADMPPNSTPIIGADAPEPSANSIPSPPLDPPAETEPQT